MRSNSSTDFSMLSDVLSDPQLSEDERKVLYALYAHKNRAEEKEIQTVSEELDMRPAFVRHHHDYALQYLAKLISASVCPARFSLLFGSGRFLPSGRAAVESRAAEPPAKMAITMEGAASLTGSARRLPQLSCFELLVLSLSFGRDGKLRSRKAIADDVRAAVKDDELLQRKLITDVTIAHAREGAREKMRACGISVWHYFAQRFLELDAMQPGKTVIVSRIPEQMRIKVDAVLCSLSEQALRALRFRCSMSRGRPLTNKAVLELLVQQGWKKNRRTLDKYFENITEVLKAENINLWTVLLAETDGHPEKLVVMK